MSDFTHFWFRCLSGGFDFTITELAYLDGICIFVGTILVLRRNKSHRKTWEQVLEGFVRKYAAILIFGQLILSVFLVAPYIQFHDEQIKNQNQEEKKDSSTYTLAVTNAPGSTLVNGSGNNVSVGNVFGDTNRPSFQLFYNDWHDTIVSTQLETNFTGGILRTQIIRKIIGISRSPETRFINPGETINLSTNQLQLFVMVNGKITADRLVIELLTPWMDENNITGASGWHNPGVKEYVFSLEEKTFNYANHMRVDYTRPLTAGYSYPLPVIYFPTNYANPSCPISFKVYSANSEEYDVGITVKLKPD